MAIVKMKKMTLIGLEEEKAEVLKALQEMGSVEIQNIGDLPEDELELFRKTESSNASVELEQKLLQVKYTLDFLGRYNKNKKGMLSGKKAVTLSRLTQVMENQDSLLDVANQCRKIEEELVASRSRQLRLQNIIAQMEPWREMDIPLEDIADTEKTRVLIGTMIREKMNSLLESFDEDEQEIFVDMISVDKEQGYYLVIFHKKIENTVFQKLKDYGFNRVTFTGYKGTPKMIIDQCEKDMKLLDEEENRIVEKTQKLLAYIDELEILHDGLSIELEKYRTMDRIYHTGKAYLLQGWVRESDQKQVEERLMRVTDALQLSFEDPGEDEVFPVALENNKFIRPFEVVTGLYSTPHSRGIDPNPYMAPFFFMFFGVMMGDAGYGLIMAIAAAFFIWKFKPKGMMGKMGLLIVFVGISTFIWGVLSGSWFGDLGEKVAKSIGLKTAALWFNPMEEPVLMLGFCFGLGLIHVFAGMGIKAYMSIKEGKVLDAIFDQGLWIILVVGLILLATPVAQVGQILAIISAVGLVLTQGRHKKNIISKLLSGLLSLYNITGILSDVLSYSRLFALGLATGVIGMVINLLASMVATSWFGWIFALAIMIGGHTFNLLINVLGAFVHDARLQYIEFFGKFFEGGGHAFSPLTIKTKFIELV